MVKSEVLFTQHYIWVHASINYLIYSLFLNHTDFSLHRIFIKLSYVCSVMSNSLWLHGAHKDPLFMGISRQENWRGLKFHTPEDLPHPEIKPVSIALKEDSLPTKSSGKPFYYSYFFANTCEYLYFYLTYNKLCRIRRVFIVLLHPLQVLI